MIKKLAVVVFFLGAVILISAYAFAEDNTVNTANPTDTSVPTTEVAPTIDTTPIDAETLPAEEGVGEGVVTGDVTALDTQAGSITIKGTDGAEKSFSVIDEETILWKGIEDIKLADIKTGDKAEVGYYTDDAGKLVASWVDVIVPEQPAAANTQTVPGSQAEPIAPAAPEAE